MKWVLYCWPWLKDTHRGKRNAATKVVQRESSHMYLLLHDIMATGTLTQHIKLMTTATSTYKAKLLSCIRIHTSYYVYKRWTMSNSSLDGHLELLCGSLSLEDSSVAVKTLTKIVQWVHSTNTSPLHTRIWPSTGMLWTIQVKNDIDCWSSLIRLSAPRCGNTSAPRSSCWLSDGFR